MNFTGCGTGERLYESIKDIPVADYHCHLSPKEIYEDKPFEDIAEMWLSADHYKWRLMRSYGIEEKYVTGDASYTEKFAAYAETLGSAPGNPLYHWSHLELEKYFGIKDFLDAGNAENIRNRANKVIRETGMSPRSLIRSSNVKIICTTDDICSDLYYHKKLAAEEKDFKVFPSFRTDNLLLVNRPGYGDYLKELGKASSINADSLDNLKKAVKKCFEGFTAAGCRFSDVGIPYFPCTYRNGIADDEEAGKIFEKVLAGKILSDEEYDGFLGNMYVFLGKMYKKAGVTMQLHLAVMRNCSWRLFELCGPDAGGDCTGDCISGRSLAKVLDTLEREDALPETIVYSLNDANLSQIASVCGAFPKVRQGAAWWFCDTEKGIERQLEVIAESSCLGTFYGMLTDSRSFLSYARHDYFRMILCGMLGRWVEEGKFDPKAAEKVAADVAYGNIMKKFR